MPGKVGMLPMKSRNPRQHDDRGLIGNGAVEIAHAATIGAAACRRGDEYPRKAALNRAGSRGGNRNQKLTTARNGEMR